MNDAIAAERDMVESNAHDNGRNQDFADRMGLSLLSLESSWWGNEKLGEWESRWWVRVDKETEKAVHVTAATTSRSTMATSELNRDVWLPKSKAEFLVQPNWEVHEPAGEMKGVITLESSRATRYGHKHDITGDTFNAMKEDGLADELPWEKTHATWNGSSWEIDAADEARDLLVKEANELGYAVKMLG